MGSQLFISNTFKEQGQWNPWWHWPVVSHVPNQTKMRNSILVLKNCNCSTILRSLSLSQRVWFQSNGQETTQRPLWRWLRGYINSRHNLNMCENSGVLASNTGARPMSYGPCNSCLSWILLYCMSKRPNRASSGGIRRCPAPLSERSNMFCVFRCMEKLFTTTAAFSQPLSYTDTSF